jgi:hypothetical protein
MNSGNCKTTAIKYQIAVLVCETPMNAESFLESVLGKADSKHSIRFVGVIANLSNYFHQIVITYSFKLRV